MIIRILIVSALLILFSQRCLAENALKVEPSILKKVDILAKAKGYAYKKYPSMKNEEYYAFLRELEDGYGVTFSTIDISEIKALGNVSGKRMVYVLLDKDKLQLKKIHLVK